MPNRSSWLHATAITIALLAAGCNSEGSDGPSIVATPTPTPAPTPAPTPTPTPPPPSSVNRIAQAEVGQFFEGPVACAGGTFTSATTGSNAGQLIDVLTIQTPKIVDNALRVDYLAVDNFRLDFNGFGGATFMPSQKTAGPMMFYDYFRNGTEEFELYRNATDMDLFFTTVGRYSDNGGSICFFAAGGPPRYVDPGSRIQSMPFLGFADGLAQIGGVSYRLFQSPANATIDYRARTAEIRLILAGYRPVFGEVPGGGSTVGDTVTGTATLDVNGYVSGTLSGPAGLTGTWVGKLFDASPTGFAVTFEVRRANGDLYFGAAGLDAQL